MMLLEGGAGKKYPEGYHTSPRPSRSDAPACSGRGLHCGPLTQPSGETHTYRTQSCEASIGELIWTFSETNPTGLGREPYRFRRRNGPRAALSEQIPKSKFPYDPNCCAHVFALSSRSKFAEPVVILLEHEDPVRRPNRPYLYRTASLLCPRKDTGGLFEIFVFWHPTEFLY
ncbi:hypothetical protein P171DRAFT_92027 [Karstenula rhodostoma CBS 690.94]|uniref:Uncharacterized protein n=1 Tax=Karstenula rhodostoma CBS 690.94 TaxID=1392251 RepID=A0A9P4U7H2_9PLEO|nr:hypothetical protein P171DRAFT_92027 [Karstenula rhodostoma CBS 690.94]